LLAFFGVLLNRSVCDGSGLNEIGLKTFHLCTDVVNFDQLFGREEADTNHPAIDQYGSRIGDRWDEIAAAKPWIAEKRATSQQSACFYLSAREWCELARIKI